jgi:hypothetical protein
LFLLFAVVNHPLPMQDSSWPEQPAFTGLLHEGRLSEAAKVSAFLDNHQLTLACRATSSALVTVEPACMHESCTVSWSAVVMVSAVLQGGDAFQTLASVWADSEARPSACLLRLSAELIPCCSLLLLTVYVSESSPCAKALD